MMPMAQPDRWGYSPPSAWGETSFGVTPDGEFLLDRVKLNSKLRMEGGTADTLPIDAVNQICDSLCPVVLYSLSLAAALSTLYI